MRATLNDELLREAGFESDYHRERERRRTVRRRAEILGLLVVIFLCSLAGGLAWLDEWLPLHIPRSLILGLVTAGVVGQGVTLLVAFAGTEHSRREIWRGAVRLGSLVLIVAAVVQLAAPYLPGLPKSIAIAVLLLGLVVQIVDFVKTRLLPWMDDQI